MLVKFSYTCHRTGCPNPHLWSYSDKGLDVLIRIHEMEHVSEILENAKKFELELRKLNKDYNKLQVTWQDVTFLITRGIRIDEDIEYVGYSRKYNEGAV